MRTLDRFPVLLLAAAALAALSAQAAVTGVVTNGTSGKPQAGITVTLLKFGGGVTTAGQAATGPEGRFRIEAPPPEGNLPYMTRVDWQGVNYFAAVRPGLPGADMNVAVEIFDATPSNTRMKIASVQTILEPRPGRLLVAEIYSVTNETSPKQTFAGAGSKETFRFAIAEGKVEDLQVQLSGTTTLPVPQKPASRGGSLYAVEHSFEPGETKVEVNYRLPYEKEAVFSRAAVNWFGGPQKTEIIAPLGTVQLISPKLALAKTEEQQGAAYYTWTGGGGLKFEMNGVLEETRAESAEGVAGGDLATLEIPSFVYQTRWWILAVFAASLALGLVHLYLTQRSAAGGASIPEGKK